MEFHAAIRSALVDNGYLRVCTLVGNHRYSRPPTYPAPMQQIFIAQIINTAYFINLVKNGVGDYGINKLSSIVEAVVAFPDTNGGHFWLLYVVSMCVGSTFADKLLFPLHQPDLRKGRKYRLNYFHRSSDTYKIWEPSQEVRELSSTVTGMEKILE